MILVTLNLYIASSVIQTSNQSKLLKCFENLSQLFNQIWKHPSYIHPSKADMAFRVGVWGGQQNLCHW